MEERYINPFTDFGFKRLFGTEMNKELLISFLNSLLNGHEEITDIRYRNTEQLGALEQDRKAVFDVYCENIAGERFIVEMQKAEQKYSTLSISIRMPSFHRAHSSTSRQW